jgi:hypothetical protein
MVEEIGLGYLCIYILEKGKWIPSNQVVTVGESQSSTFFNSFIYFVIFKFGPLKYTDCITAGKL